jgi:CMP-N,N'-diacetyllegionaminic acid synthase
MKILALITARGGSKRVPGKNIRRLGGKPLIDWSIDIVKDIPEICDVLVTTDDPEIADTARDAGASVPWLRPAELATDTATSVDVSLHALNWYESENEKVDGLLLLQPTSPFRTRATIQRGIALYKDHHQCPVLGVSPAKSHPMWCYSLDGATMRSFIENKGEHLRSQDLPPAYVVNGAFYLIAPKDLRVNHSFYGGNMTPLVIGEPGESLDIDTELDWMIAETVMKTLEHE